MHTTIIDYGPDLRSIQRALEFPDFALNALEEEVWELPPAVLTKIVRSLGGLDGHRSSSIISSFCLSRVEQNSDAPDLLRHSIANKHVWRHIINAYTYERPDEMRELFTTFWRAPQTATTAGWLFEAWAHYCLCQGGTFTLKRLACSGERLEHHPERGDIDLKFPLLKTELFENQAVTEDTKFPGTYYIPRDTRNPTFDAFARFENQRLGLQMSLCATQSLNPDGLCALRARLGVHNKPAKFIFVVHAGRPFECPAPSTVDLEFFDFYTLELSSRIGTIRSLCVLLLN